MQTLNKLIMLSVVVSDMHKSKEFYSDKLGFKVATDYRQDDDNWWVGLAALKGGAVITLAKVKGSKPGKVTLYFSTFDVVAAHKELEGKDVKVNDVKDDLFGPGSGVKFFNFEDPDGNLIHIAQAEKTPWA